MLRRVLSAAGVGALYGRALPGFEVTEVADPSVAVLLAQAHRSVGGHGCRRPPRRRERSWYRVAASTPVPCAGAARVAQVEVADAATLRGLAPVVAEAARGAGLRDPAGSGSRPRRVRRMARWSDPASTADWLADDASR